MTSKRLLQRKRVSQIKKGEYLYVSDRWRKALSDGRECTFRFGSSTISVGESHWITVPDNMLFPVRKTPPRDKYAF